jgi:hypothetical protein
VHAPFCRSHPRSRTSVVQYGDMWKPREAGGASPPREGAPPLNRRVKPAELLTNVGGAVCGAHVGRGPIIVASIVGWISSCAIHQLRRQAGGLGQKRGGWRKSLSTLQRRGRGAIQPAMLKSCGSLIAGRRLTAHGRPLPMSADAGWSDSARRPASRPLQNSYPRSSAFIRGNIALPSMTTRQASPSAIVNERRKEHRRPAHRRSGQNRPPPAPARPTPRSHTRPGPWHAAPQWTPTIVEPTETFR